MSRLIRLPEVEYLTGMKKSAIYKKIKAQCFPTAVKLGTKHVAWKIDEVQQWIEDLPRA